MAADRDGRDGEALHVVAVAGGRVVGTCRLLVDDGVARLGRMAVEPERRGQGVGARDPGARPTAWPAGGGAERMRLHAQTSRAPLYQRAGYERAGDALRRGGHRARDHGEAACLSCASTRCRGLRVIVAGERGARPGAWLDPAPRARRSTRTSDPVPRGPRGPHAARGLRAAPGRRRRPTRPAGACAWCRTSFPALAPGADEPGADPLAAGRGEPELFAARPAAGAHEVIVNAPEPVGSLVELAPDQAGGGDGRLARAHARPRRRAAYVHVIVNEGREAGRLAPAHARAALRAAASCPPRSPASASASPPTATAPRAATCSRTWCRRRCAGASAWWRWTPRPWRSARSPRACRSTCRSCRAGPRARFEDDGPLGAALLHDGPGRLGANWAALPPFNLWVRTAPRGAERFCWRIDLLPRLAHLAGLEMGTGVQLNVLAPEDAAERLRAGEPVGFRAAMPPVPAPDADVRRRAAAGAAALRPLGRGAGRALPASRADRH